MNEVVVLAAQCSREVLIEVLVVGAFASAVMVLLGRLSTEQAVAASIHYVTSW